MFSKTTKFESLLEAVPDALVGMDQSGMIRFVNHQTESLFGYHRDDLVGRHIETLVPEDLWPIYAEHREDYFSDPRTRWMGLDLELRAKNRQGGEFPVEVSLSPIDTGDVLLEVTAVQDVKSQKQAFENAERMTAIIHYSDDAIIGKTLGGTITSWNPAAERMYGYSSAEVIGKSINILAPEGRTGEIDAILARVRRGQAVEHHVTVRVRKDARLIAVSISVSPIRDEDGEIVGACTIARDVTDRQDAAEATRTMLESSQDSLVSISPEGAITDANEATVKITGVPRERLIGTAFSDCFTDPERANEVYQRVFTDGNAVDYPLTIRSQNGTLTEVLFNASAYRDRAGNVVGAFAAARDVTSQMRAQRMNAEQQAREREQQAREREQLLELQQFQRLTIGRELKITELKKENERLRALIPGGLTEPGDRR